MARSFIKHLICVLFCTIPSILSSSNSEYSNSHPLNRLEKYEEVFYDIKAVHDNHHRVLRSLDSNLYLNFNNYQRNFKIKLSPSKSLYDKNAIELDNQQVPANQFTFYNGQLIDEPNSRVTGSVIDGVFYGTIETENGIYQIESSKRYDGEFASHSIIYHENDIKPDNKSIICETANMNEENDTKIEPNKHHSINNENNLNRKKRAVTPFPDGKSVCGLYMRVDQYYYNQVYSNEGNKNSARTMNFIMSYLNSYVTYINTIYSSLLFSSGSTDYTGLNFSIRRIRILTPDVCNNQSALSVGEKLICKSDKYDATTLLNSVSKDNYSEYCLSVTFTGRDLVGLLGLAWIAQVGGNWGVCGTVNNTGIVSIIRSNNRELELSTKLTLSHELGHNFGAQHDSYSSGCLSDSYPGGTAGNYIMYPYSQSGTLANNNKFSSCSIISMSKVVAAVVGDKGRFCFRAPNLPVCGNMVIEAGEDCDCGFPGDCTESCCNPSNCKLNAGAKCSPSQGPCCNANCNFTSSTTICYTETDCVKPVNCTGSSYVCPYTDFQYFKQPTTGLYQLCNSGLQVCINGTCTGSICQNYNMEQCYLPGNLADKTVNKTALCHLGCSGNLTNYVCKDTFEIPIFNKSGKVLKAGSICAVQGFCDIFSKCRVSDEQNALAILGQLILNPPTSAEIQTWFQTYWWAILLVFLGFLLVLGLIGFLIFKCTDHQHPWKEEESKNRQKNEQKSALD